MNRSFRFVAVTCLGLLAAFAMADQAQVRVTFYPSIAVADGQTVINVNAEVRDSSGRQVPNGTQVMFTSTLGEFQNNVVATANSVAHAQLKAGGIAGEATITVTPVNMDGNPTVITYDFVGSKAELSSAREYVEVVAPSYMQYAADTKVIGAAAANKSVSLRYRDIFIQADDLQYDISTYVVKARNARLHIGKLVQDFDELNLTLNRHSGLGLTTMTARNSDALGLAGPFPVFLKERDDGTYEIAQPEKRFGMVEIHRDTLLPYPAGIAPSAFAFKDLSTSPSTVSARRAVVFPRRGIQFEGAQIYVANAKIVKLPLFMLDFSQSTSPIITDTIFSVNDNQIGVNYPQYLILRPGLTSDLRFHMGDRYGRDLGSDNGAFLDYELNWDKGDDMQGGLTFGGIGRDDWTFDINQYMRYDEHTSATAEFTLPAESGFYASGTVTHQFVGYSGGLMANHSQTFTGFQSSSQSYGADLTSDSRRIHGTPFKLSYGAEDTESLSDDEFLGRRQQSGSGLMAQLQSDTIPLDRQTALTSSWTFSKLYGINEENGIGVVGAVNVNRRLSKNWSALLTYNYTQDGFTDAEIGRHMMTLQTNYHAGKFEADFMSSKSLGIDRLNEYWDASYLISKLWRVSYNYTSERYLGDQFLDYDFALGYRIGWREVGITWTKSTGRFGLELLGAQF